MFSYHGHQLPVFFVEGYIKAFVQATGNPNADAFYRAAARRTFTSGEERYQILSSLETYFERPIFSYHLSERRPLDYALLALLFEGMVEANERHPKRDELVRRLSWHTGLLWWLGRAPVSTHLDEGRSLWKLTTSHVESYLDIWKYGSPGITVTTVKSSQELAKMGIIAFFETLQQQADIYCDIHQAEPELVVHFPECPFCLNRSPDCRVFWGITMGLIEWLHGTHHFNAVPTTLQMNEANSTSHTLVLEPLNILSR
ncbi:MAG: hypothetical protein HC876_16715 [Chloroflexaceae bacterium]|nr:hypothetical protein [Chloroflexaceae bacterium]